MNFKETDIIAWSSTYYGLNIEACLLNGYDEINYLLKEKSGKKYILKIATKAHGLSFLDAQVKIINHLSKSPVASKFQQFVLNRDGQELTTLLVDNTYYYLRILHFLEGTFWVDCVEKTEALYSDLGQLLAQMDVSLNDFSHPAMHRHYTWDISTALDAYHKINCISNPEKRRIAGYFLLQFEMKVAHRISLLRHAYAHNDANDYNLLVKDNHISGLIDFGDMVYTALINNVAVACTYAMLHHKQPLHAAALVLKGYHAILPLMEQELDLLFYLIAARLCISVTQSAFHLAASSNNDHHFITETPAWDLLYQLIEINPLKARDCFRTACGFHSDLNKGDHQELLHQRMEHIGRNLSIGYHENIKIEQGALQYLYDDQGRTFVDCVNNPSHIGHCHPVYVKRMQQQIAHLNTNTRYLSDLLVEYASKLTATLPPALSVCYFTNSGSEANDLAVRMSRHFTRQKDIIVLDHAYHGTSTVAMEMSPYKFDGKGGFGKMPWIHKAMNPDGYRGPYKYADPQSGLYYAADVDQIVKNLKAAGKAPAAFICETLLGVGGQMPLPPNYLKEVYQIIRRAGGICIADEVQVGFGRVGEAFWGFELQEVVPDIVVMGKPIGNGHPLAAVVVTNEIANAFNNGMEYFNTYGGNPVSMTAGIAVLDIIKEESMQQHALEVGNYLIAGLKKLMAAYPVISDVRGHGLFIGAEFVTSRTTLAPAVKEINQVVEYMKSKGYLLSTDGPLHNVLKIKPPMTFNKQNADALLKFLEAALKEIS